MRDSRMPLFFAFDTMQPNDRRMFVHKFQSDRSRHFMQDQATRDHHGPVKSVRNATRPASVTTPGNTQTLMTRTLLAFGIVLLFSFPARAQQAPPASTDDAHVQPGQTAPAQAPAPNLNPPPAPASQNQTPAAPTPQPQTGQSQGAQQPKKPQKQTGDRHQLNVTTNLVIVPTTVKNRDGVLIGDLSRDEFRVYCDNVEQQIVFFTSDPFPLSAVVLIDNNLSIKSAEQVQKSLVAISGGFGPSDEVALVTYDQFPNTVADFSFNNDELFTKLKRLDLQSHYPGAPVGGPLTAGPTVNGRSAENGLPTPLGVRQETETKDLDDAVYAAGEMLKGRGRDRRKIIFLISDGNNSRSNSHTLDQTIQLLLNSDVSVYSISVGHALLQHQSTRLEKYAQTTGGDTFYAGKDRGLENLYAAVTEQARNQYTLSFSPKDIAKGADFHGIEVRVRRPQLDVTAREGYYQSGLH
jgi:VWFA-related protein